MIRLALVILLLCGALDGCDRNSRDSLVGTWQIASDAELTQEQITLWFRKKNGEEYPGTLSYSLEPNGLLNIERGRDHAVCCFGGIDEHIVDAHWQRKLSPVDQATIRRMLARLRPQVLSKEVPFALPKGCSFVMDDLPWSGVSFARGKLGGAFVFQSDCKGAGADNARRLLHAIVEKLPPVEGSAGFLGAN